MTIYVKPKFYSPNGNPIAGGFVKVLEAGSKSTLKTTYSNSSLTTPNPNPIVLDGEGGADIWFSGPADYEVYDSNMVLQWTQKSVYGFGSSSINIDSTNRTVRNLRADDDFDVTLGNASDRCKKIIYFGCDGEPQLISPAELDTLLGLRNLRADDDFNVTLGYASDRFEKMIYFGRDGEPQLKSIAELDYLLGLNRVVGYADLGWFTYDPYLYADLGLFTDDATDFVDFVDFESFFVWRTWDGSTEVELMTLDPTGLLTVSGGVSTTTLALTTALTVPNGGTGVSTITGYVKGNGTSAFTASATIPVGDISGTLPVGSGGTGVSTITGYVKGNGTSAFTASATIPAGDISGTLPVANGGTGLTTIPAGRIMYGNGTSAVSTSANLTYDGTNFTVMGKLLQNSSTAPSASTVKHLLGFSGASFTQYTDTNTNLGISFGCGTDGSANWYTHTGAVGSETYTQRMVLTAAGNLGIGTTSPSAKIHAISTTEQLRLGYDNSNYASHTVDSSGNYTIAPTGGLLTVSGGVSNVLALGYYNANFEGQYNNLSTNQHGTFSLGVNVVVGGGSSDDLRIPNTHPTLSGSGIFIQGNAGDNSNDILFFSQKSANVTQGDTIPLSNARMILKNTSGNLGIGIGDTYPSARIHAVSTTEQLRLGYDNSNYVGHTVDASGNYTIAPTGGLFTATLNSRSLVLSSPTTGSFLMNSGSASMTGGFNTALGYQALYYNTTGYHNTALGVDALYSNTSGYYNTALGYQALYSNTTGYDNTAIGYYALRSNTTGYSNTALGFQALYYNTSGYYNTALGYQALYSNNANSNTAIGAFALRSNTTGDSNTALGYQAGNSLTTGANCSLFGNNAQPSSASVSNEITLGNGSVTTLRCNATTITALSDKRDKSKIKEIKNALDFINDLIPVSFEWDRRDGSMKGVKDSGFIAQDLDKAQKKHNINYLHNLVYNSNPNKLEASYGKLLPMIVAAIREIDDKIDMIMSKRTE